MKKQANVNGSKVFTVVFCIFLVVLMIFAFIYVALCEDFTKPGASSDGDQTVETDVWDYTWDDMFAYLEETGLIDVTNKSPMSTVGTENWVIDGVDFIWWDVENLVEGTEEYDYWQELQENDNLYVMFAGTVYSLTVNGPFAMHINSNYPGNNDALTEAFMAFPSAWSGASTSSSGNSAVWNYTWDDMYDYLGETGLLDMSDINLLSTVGTENWLIDGVDFMWWDVDNLVEGTEEYDYWQELQENDNLYVMFAGTVYSLTVNGPFAMHINSTYPGNDNELTEAFMAFPSAWSGASAD